MCQEFFLAVFTTKIECLAITLNFWGVRIDSHLHAAQIIVLPTDRALR